MPGFLAGSPETRGAGGGAHGVHERVARHPESVSTALRMAAGHLRGGGVRALEEG